MIDKLDEVGCEPKCEYQVLKVNRYSVVFEQLTQHVHPA